MDANDFALRLVGSITKTTGSVLRPLSDGELYIYLEWVRYMLVFGATTPYGLFGGYPPEFCRAELEYLRTLIAEPLDSLPSLGDYSDPEYGRHLRTGVTAFLPDWCANTSNGSLRQAQVLPAYVYPPAGDDDDTIYLVNEGLPPAKGYDDRGVFPLRRLYEDTWYVFDTFPYPYDREQGRAVKMHGGAG